MPKLLAVLVTFLAAACVLAPSASAAAHQLRGTNLTPDWYRQNPNDNAREIAAAKAAGYELLRVSIPFQYFETSRNVYDRAYLAQIDQLFAQLKTYEMKAQVVVGGTPCWDTTKVTVGDPCAPGWEATNVPVHPPKNPSLFAAYSVYIVAHWRPQIAAIELWNEPNHTQFWTGTAAEYVALAKPAYRALKAVAPNLPVLGASLALSDTEWLAAAYAAGLRGTFDALAVHPYDIRFDGAPKGFGDPQAIWADSLAEYSFRTGLPKVRDLMVANGDADKPIWLTEFGYASCPATPFCVTGEMQGFWLYRAFEQAAAFPWVEAALSYRMRDRPLPRGTWEDTFGVIRGDFTAKKSLAYIQATIPYLNDHERTGRVGPYLSASETSSIATIARHRGSRVARSMPIDLRRTITRKWKALRGQRVASRFGRKWRVIDSRARRSKPSPGWGGA